jgi:DnaJ-class molecular chaperone
LIVDQAVDLWDLVLGGTIAVTDIRGAELQMTLAAGTQPGSMLRLRGRGLPESDIPGKQGGPGDLLVRVGVRIPEQISPELVAAIRQERGN